MVNKPPRNLFLGLLRTQLPSLAETSRKAEERPESRAESEIWKASSKTAKLAYGTNQFAKGAPPYTQTHTQGEQNQHTPLA